MVDKVKICSYCALFGQHKDHTFKSEQQLFSEIDKKIKGLLQLETFYHQVTAKVEGKKELRNIEEYCHNLKNEALNELEDQYRQITAKLNEIKKEKENDIIDQFGIILKRCKDEWDQCEIDLAEYKLFMDWKNCGQETLHKMKTRLKASHIEEICKNYEVFPW